MKTQFIVTVDTKDAIPETMCDALAQRAYAIMVNKGFRADVTAGRVQSLPVYTEARLAAMDRAGEVTP